MKKSTKAMLWSGLIFPGCGHFSLKSNRRGLLWLVPALLAVAVFVHGLIVRAEFVMDKVESGAVPLDPVAIATLLDSVPDTQMTSVAFWVFVVCWIGALVDAYSLGAKRDKESGGV